MADLTVDVNWFKVHIDRWEALRLDLSQSWGNLEAAGTTLPPMNPRMPDDLQAVVPKLVAAKQTLCDNFDQGAQAAQAFIDLLHQTATAYVKNEAANQDEIDSLNQELNE